MLAVPFRAIVVVHLAMFEQFWTRKASVLQLGIPDGNRLPDHIEY